LDHDKNAAGGVLTAKQAPRRPGTALALGLRAGEVAVTILPQIAFGKETRPMRFSFLRDVRTPVSAQARPGRRRPPTPRARLRLEPLEDRCLLNVDITLTPSEPAPQLVGQPITWTATVPDAPPGLVYQFSVGSPGGPFQMARDFSPDNHFVWAPM
jgi:hypothetical protein